ncbi:MAG: TetR/AcrR family transcriptional regulator [Alphaproteobacteria bacterium]|nr:TetR/AcrR family transcriptional regulator [Alphaproteobacteria bacterium]
MAKKKPASPRKMPEQDRSRATVDVIVDAAARILVKDGYDAFTTNRVAEKAGVSIGSLYQYFPNKDALLSELMRRHTTDLEKGIEAMVARAADAPLAEVIRAAVEHNVQSHLIDPALHRVLSEEVPRLGKLDWQAAFAERMTHRVRAAFEARRSEIVVPDLDLAVYIVTRTVETVIHNAVTQRSHDLKSGALAEEVTRMIVSFLTGKPLAAKRSVRAAAE